MMEFISYLALIDPNRNLKSLSVQPTGSGIPDSKRVKEAPKAERAEEDTGDSEERYAEPGESFH
jgi:hypothetical protein